MQETERFLYPDQLKSPQWAAKRLEIFKRDSFKCVYCYSDKNLQCHHRRYIQGRMAWEVPDKLLETVCHACHKQIHTGININSFVVAERKPKAKFHKKPKKKKSDKFKLKGRDKALQKRYDKLRAA